MEQRADMTMSDSADAGAQPRGANIGSSSQGNSPEDNSPSGNSPDDDRRRRAAIAAQACQTCRTRKSKCDEKRPKCSLCERLGVNCVYREPQPTKKDKTLVEMMNILTRIDAKVNEIGSSVSAASSRRASATKSSPSSTSASLAMSPGVFTPSGLTHASGSPNNNGHRMPEIRDEAPTIRAVRHGRLLYPHFSPPHRLLAWPAIANQLGQSHIDTDGDLPHIMERGTSFFIRKELDKHPNVLTADSELVHQFLPPSDITHGLALGMRVQFPSLSYEHMRTVVRSYFTTFHCTNPVLDATEFENESVRLVLRHGFGYNCSDSVIVLLVLALGEMAIGGMSGPRWTGHPNSGIRGGSLEEPPGLIYFNEARKRMGFIATKCSLKNVQVMVLFAIYYEACSRHMDFYRAVMDACTAMQLVITTEKLIDWRSPYGNHVRMVFHVCCSLENWFHFDLDQPGTNINDMTDIVPLPGNDTPFSAPEEQRIALNFLATASLTRVISRVQEGMYQEVVTSELGIPYTGPPYQLLKELTRQLDNWRNLLPQSLQWYDDDRLNFPLGDQRSRNQGNKLFALRAEDVSPSGLTPGLETMQAEMRARYYYTLMLINRPSVYKMMHYPDQINDKDRQAIIQCYRSCLLWPVALHPLKDRKRLVPYLFAWTTNFMTILILLREVVRPGELRKIVDHFILPEEIEHTIITLMDWLADMAQIDGTAEWSYRILRQVYADVTFITTPLLME